MRRGLRRVARLAEQPAEDGVGLGACRIAPDDGARGGERLRERARSLQRAGFAI